MNNGIRIPTCNAATLEGRHVASGTNETSAHLNGSLVSCQENFNISKISGNRCGHDINSPTIFVPPSKHRRRPPLIHKAKRNLAKLYDDPMLFLAGKLSYNPIKQNKKGGNRKMRSEQRDLINNCVGECLLHYLDLKTMKVGFEKQNGDFHYFGINFIHKAIRESLIEQKEQKTITYERVREAIKTLEAAGYLYIENDRIHRPDGTYRSLPAKIRFNLSFFNDLGIEDHILTKSLANEEQRLNKEILHQKARDYREADRKKLADKRIQKKHMRAMKDLLKDSKSGKRLSAEEKKFMDVECPGHDRKRDPSDIPAEYLYGLVKYPPY